MQLERNSQHWEAEEGRGYYYVSSSSESVTQLRYSKTSPLLVRKKLGAAFNESSAFERSVSSGILSSSSEAAGSVCAISNNALENYCIGGVAGGGAGD